VGLEEDAQASPDPFLQKALMLVVDGTDLQELRTMLEIDITLDEHHGEAEGKVFESAGGFSPTIGIIGAVLGLIQVMKNLANIDEVGHGIAVSFVATVYGVGAANLLFLPAAAKIKASIQLETQRKEMILEAVCGIIEGLNPKLIRSKLAGYAHNEAGKGKKAKAKAGDSTTKADEKPAAPVPAKA
jgi:chemotaxis protein MotA